MIIEVKERIKYEEFYMLIVPDIAAGRKARYTVYKIRSSPGSSREGRAVVVGRELTLTAARRCAKCYEPER